MQAVFSLASKNSGGYEYMFAVQRAEKKLPEKYVQGDRKVQLS